MANKVVIPVQIQASTTRFDQHRVSLFAELSYPCKYRLLEHPFEGRAYWSYKLSYPFKYRLLQPVDAQLCFEYSKLSYLFKYRLLQHNPKDVYGCNSCHTRSNYRLLQPFYSNIGWPNYQVVIPVQIQASATMRQEPSAKTADVVIPVQTQASTTQRHRKLKL